MIPTGSDLEGTMGTGRSEMARHESKDPERSSSFSSLDGASICAIVLLFSAILAGVVGPDGTARGHIEVPRRWRVRWVGERGFIAVEPDELDVPWVVRYRVEY
jgi:hypothetical protein